MKKKRGSVKFSKLLKQTVFAILIFGIILLASERILSFVLIKPLTTFINVDELGKGVPVVVSKEPYSKWERGSLEQVPSIENGSLDVRSYMLDKIKLTEENLDYIEFDTDTEWVDSLPESFSPEEVMETGKNPGLGIKELHKQGITGKGVNIAIIDQGLLLEHEEYADNIMMYEKIHCYDEGASMHGPAVTSIAVGKNIGVAPDAKVYYIASTFGTYTLLSGKTNLKYMAEGIERVLEINKALPEDEKISVISISMGHEKGMNGYKKVYEAIERAKEAGIFVITTSTARNYDFNLWGLGRLLHDDPESADSYGPGIFWEDYYTSNLELENKAFQNMLMVPMDSRTYASFTETDSYAFSRSGGLSWSVPWLAGMYALCVQVNPDITPEEFIESALNTGSTVPYEYEGKTYQFGNIINPQKLIETVKN